ASCGSRGGGAHAVARCQAARPRPEGAAARRDRRPAGPLPRGVRDARPGRLHARGDRRRARRPDRDVQGAAVPRARPAAQGAGTLRGGVGRMSEDRLDELTRHLARSYNAPPETPREELWAAISAARRASHPDPRPGRFAWLGRLGALAAMLALGLGIGRFAAREGGAPSGGVQRGPVAERAAADTPVQPASLLRDSLGGPPPAPTRMVVLGQGNDGLAHDERAEVRDGPRFAAEVRARPPERAAPRVADAERGAWRSGEETEQNPVYTL